MINQINTQMSSQKLSAPPSSSITSHGVMASLSTAGTIPFPSSSFRLENNRLTFQHQCYSVLANSLPSGAWIIDSGATSHVCSNLALFADTRPVSHTTVTLPNGTRETISHIGTIHLSSSLILSNVLFVPSFRFNLISFSTLLAHSIASAHFYPDFCIIQDLSQAWTIGRGRLLHRLYILDVDDLEPTAFSASLFTEGDLWHH